MFRIFALVTLLAAGTAVSAGEIGYAEDFALAKDRTKALEKLIPGTEDYYYYHCLHYQHTEQFDKVDDTLKAWIKRYKYTARVKEIQNRQTLLTYAKNPQASLAFLRQRLGLTFNHQRERLNQKPNLPTTLDQKLIARETLTARANRTYQNLNGFENRALDWLVATPLNADRRRNLLQRLQRPDHAGLPKLIVDDLNYKYSKNFGSFAIHRQLLLTQLDDCLKLKPDLLNQTAFVNAYLQHANSFVAACGGYIDSPLLMIDPVARNTYQHMEYRPLVNARAHQLGRRRRILNDRFDQQYHRLMKQLTYHRSLDDVDLLAVTYYMLLQDRVDEALQFYGRVNPDNLQTKLQYDYLSTYVDLYTGDTAAARIIAAKYAAHPVDRWRKAFIAVIAQLDEIEGADVRLVDTKARTETQTKLAASQAGFNFKVESKQIKLNFQNLERVQVNYYLMDVELLFSRNPFVQQQSGQFAYIRPVLHRF
jgi:hypothetical protein